MSRKISSIILITIAIATFFFYVNPSYEDIKVLKMENSEFDEALDKARELQEVRDNLLSKYNSFSSGDIERLGKLLPDNVDNVRLILDLISKRKVKISRPASDEPSRPSDVRRASSPPSPARKKLYKENKTTTATRKIIAFLYFSKSFFIFISTNRFLS